jgi:hypothetical protein
MAIREAETRDMPVLVDMMSKMIKHIRTHCTHDRFAQNDNKLIGGIMLFVGEKMHDRNAVILVCEDEKGDNLNGFLIGRIIVAEPFMQDTVLGDIQALYPIAFGITESLSVAFDDWAKSRGATARVGRVEYGDAVVNKVYLKRNKMVPLFTECFLPYSGGGS